MTTQNSINKTTLAQLGALPGYQLVATRCGINGQAGFVPTSAYAGLQNRIRHTLPYGAKSLVFVYGGFKVASAIEVSMNPGAGYAASAASVISGGSGYAVGDTITPTVAANQVAPKLLVQSVSSGAVTSLSVVVGGMFGVCPTGTLTQASTSGSGSGCTLSLAVQSYVAGLHVGLEQVWNTQTAYSNSNPTGVITLTKGANYNGTDPNLMLGCGDFFFTDPVYVTLPANAAIGSRSFSNGYNIAPGRSLSGSDGIGLNEYAQYGDQTDRAGGGTYPTTISAYLNTGFQPLAILGTLDTPKPSFVIIGDSIGQGLVSVSGGGIQGDTFDSAGNMGWIEKSSGQQVAWTNYSSSGDRIINYLTPAQNMRLRAIATFRPSHVVDELGVNDFIGGVSFATFQAQKIAFWNKILSMGVKEIWITTITPRTTSTDGFATLTNQTVFTNDSARQSYNSWVRTLSNVSAYGVTKLLDIAATVESGTSGKWVVGMSYDGTHPSSAASTAIVSVQSATFAAATL